MKAFSKFLLIIIVAMLIAAISQAQVKHEVIWNSTPMVTLGINEDATVSNDTTIERVVGLILPPSALVRITFLSKALEVPVTQYIEISGISNTNGVLGGVDKNDWIKYAAAIRPTHKMISYTYAMDKEGVPGVDIGGGVQFRTGSITGPVFAEIPLPITGGWGAFVTIEIPIKTPVTADEIFVTFNNSPRNTGSGGNIKNSLVIK